jgi:acetyl-CoA carboxylase carboxyl transferase subunit alpha
MRLAALAEKFSLPVVTFVDTPGAYPGREAEERGQAEAIAKSLEVFARLKTPVVVVITGEGGSGGALAIAVGDRILMMENAIYSVISPEGCAGILWRDGTKVPEAAEALKITASDLLENGVVDEIIKEPKQGAHKNKKAACASIKKAIVSNLKELAKIDIDELIECRYNKFCAFGRV